MIIPSNCRSGKAYVSNILSYTLKPHHTSKTNKICENKIPTKAVANHEGRGKGSAAENFHKQESKSNAHTNLSD